MDPFIGQIVMFGGNFAPRDWAFCNGQLLPIAQNTALFSILGTIYGGDGRTTFALPDLRGRIAMHFGSGAGLPSYSIGQKGGIFQAQLTAAQIPTHNHTYNMPCNATAANTDDPDGAYPAISQENIYNPVSDSAMAPGTTSTYGGGQSFSIQNPFQCVSFIIALQGTFPSRN